MSFATDFLAFLKKYNAVALAVAFIISTSAAKLVSAIVNDLIMPIIGALTPTGDWQTATLAFGPVDFLMGDLISALLDFLLVAIVVFLIIKWVMKQDPNEKK